MRFEERPALLAVDLITGLRGARVLLLRYRPGRPAGLRRLDTLVTTGCTGLFDVDAGYGDVLGLDEAIG